MLFGCHATWVCRTSSARPSPGLRRDLVALLRVPAARFLPVQSTWCVGAIATY
ncbi:hypothetical protein ACFVTP_19215 [Streptomyces celluloflavus]|uniref:hypothetical protein n=1 Tax=Streptomyces celluloflavus TaxID=58344 RepID=UPI0036DA305F